MTEEEKYPNPRWLLHKTKEQKKLRMIRYNMLRDRGYCPKAAHRAMDFGAQKFQHLIDEFNDDFNQFGGRS